MFLLFFSFIQTTRRRRVFGYLTLLPFRRVVGLNCLGLNDYGGIAALVELRLVGDGPRDIARGEDNGRQDDSHN